MKRRRPTGIRPLCPLSCNSHRKSLSLSLANLTEESNQCSNNKWPPTERSAQSCVPGKREVERIRYESSAAAVALTLSSRVGLLLCILSPSRFFDTTTTSLPASKAVKVEGQARSMCSLRGTSTLIAPSQQAWSLGLSLASSPQ